MFNLHDWVKRGFISAINCGQNEYWIILTATPYLEKGILTEEDLVEFQSILDARIEAQKVSEEAVNENLEESVEESSEETV